MSVGRLLPGPGRPGAVLAAGLAAALAAPGARAQTFGPDDRGPHESTQNFALELRLGPYLPDVDSEFGSGGARPFRDIFGTAPRWLFAAEFDWQIVRIAPVLSLGVGASLGYTSISGTSPFTNMMAGNDPDQWTLSSETTTLNTIPTTLVAVARFDGLARRSRWMPLVPYVKAGLAYSLWWITNGRGTARSEGDMPREAIGGSLGYHAAAGLALSLEFFEPGMQRQWDASSGVNHSYAFVEVWHTGMPNIGRRQLNLGATTFTFGVAVEF